MRRTSTRLWPRFPQLPVPINVTLAAALALYGLCGTLTTTAAAASYGVGAGAGTRPALSVQYRASTATSLHVTSHLSDERVVLTGDVQRRWMPAFGYGNGLKLDLYAGLGAEGTSERRDDGDESYRLRLPLGIEWDIRAAAIAAFAEVAPTVGPLPKTRLSTAALVGLRALF